MQIENIGYINTLLYNLPDGRLVAAPIMPSETEYKYSASRCRVTAKGELIKHPKYTYFIKPPTFYELTSTRYRKAARANKAFLDKKVRSHPKPDMLWPMGDTQFWTMWLLRVVKRGAKVIRLFYGGDPFTHKEVHFNFMGFLFEFICLKKDPKMFNEIKNRLQYHVLKPDWDTIGDLTELPGDLQIHIWTANTDEINSMNNYLWDLDGGVLRDTVAIISETQSYMDLPLYCPYRVIYCWEEEDMEGAITEMEVAPKMGLDPHGFEKQEWKVKLPKGACDLWRQDTEK